VGVNGTLVRPRRTLQSSITCQSLNPENENEFRQFQRNKMPVDRGTGMFYDLQSSLESEENFIEDDDLRISFNYIGVLSHTLVIPNKTTTLPFT
jgi:hypothetical protein